MLDKHSGLFFKLPNRKSCIEQIYQLLFVLNPHNKYYYQSIAGKTTIRIAKELTREGIPTPRRKSEWSAHTVESILTNEKYKGAALLQKTYTVDFLRKKTKVNEGEVPQYYVENSHPAIIVPEEWDRVQVEFARRKKDNRGPRYENIFSRMVVCGDCGAVYGPVVWHSNDKYRRVVWRCANKFENEVKCETTHLTEEIMKEKFVEMLGIYFADRKGIIDSLRYVQRNLTDTSAIDEDIADTEREMDMLAEMLHQTVMMNASASVGEEEYRHRYNDLTERFKTEEEKYAQLVAERDRMKEESVAIGGMILELTELKQLPIEFDEKLWFATVDHVTVYGDDALVYSLRDGTEVTVEL